MLINCSTYSDALAGEEVTNPAKLCGRRIGSVAMDSEKLLIAKGRAKFANLVKSAETGFGGWFFVFHQADTQWGQPPVHQFYPILWDACGVSGKRSLDLSGEHEFTSIRKCCGSVEQQR